MVEGLEPLPAFKYHPDPLATGAIKRSGTHCPVCDRDRPYVYALSPYGEEEVEGLCPWCIADGSAAAMYDIFFTVPDSYAIDGAARDELEHRTPDFASWQEVPWPDHCGDYCAFIGYVGWAEIALLADDLREDIERMKQDFGLSQTELEQWINGAAIQGYLFRCPICGHHRLLYDTN